MGEDFFRNPLELKVGSLEHFPEKMRSFARGSTTASSLTTFGISSSLRTTRRSSKASTTLLLSLRARLGGELAYEKDLYAVPVVATVNYSTKNLELLETSDWLKLPGNRVLVKFPPAAPAAEG